MDLDEINLETDEDDDSMAVTPAELIERLEEAWLNEKFAPEILPNKFEVVELLLDQISYMETNIRSLSSTDLTKSIYQLEVDRLRFLVSSYLRQRLEKIEVYAMHILQQEDQRNQQGILSYLTAEELKFARDYSEGLQQHFDNITSVYPRFPREEWSQETVKPNIHSFVFLKSKCEVEGVVIDQGTSAEGDLVDLYPGSQAIISYSSVANFVKNGDVQLI